MNLVEILTQDMSTGKPILLATNSYAPDYQEQDRTVGEMYNAGLIIPRSQKNKAVQKARSKAKAEVATPAWIVNQMLSFLDEDWFGYKDVFNVQDGTKWVTQERPVRFPTDKGWRAYITTTYIEITCGEAPFLVSRYDPVIGDAIQIKDRIGVLDRKLRVIGENVSTREEWLEWATIAYQSTYGYEWQGDSLLLARLNLLETFEEYSLARWGVPASQEELEQIARIIVWNVWQMDGLKGVIPFDGTEALVRDWAGDEIVTYNSIGKGAKES